MLKNELSNIEIVIYVLQKLGGSLKKIATEDIAIECFRLAHDRFSWVKYSQYPDMEPVRVALFDARKEKAGALVRGRHGARGEKATSDGWILSTKGIDYIRQHGDRIRIELDDNEKISKRTITGRQINEMRKSKAFQKYMKKGSLIDVKQYEFTDFLNAGLDTPSTILKDRIDQAEAVAADVGDVDLMAFIKASRSHFQSMIK